MRFCTHCGKEIMEEAIICIHCGCSATPTTAIPNLSSNYALLSKLSERLRTNGIIWIVIAVLQILIGISGALWVLIVGILNIVSAIKDINYSKTVLDNPSGIVNSYESLTGPIITLIYNLIIGGVIGVIGSIYYFTALRGFVMENKDAFLAIEATSFAKNC